MGSLKTVRMDTHFLSEGAGCLIFSQQKGMSWQILPPVGLPPFVCRAAAPPPQEASFTGAIGGAVCLGGKLGCDSTPPSQKARGSTSWARANGSSF